MVTPKLQGDRKPTVKRTERGWAGHFICAHYCQFRRNTLLEYGRKKIVVSSVGNMITDLNDAKKRKVETIGHNRYFETRVFHANKKDKRYYDADVSKQVFFDSPWAIDHKDADDKANDMHEAVVKEITQKLLNGDKL